MPAQPLSAPEREEIRAGIERCETDSVIAGRLGRHRATINAEINRNGGRARYTATAAQTRADSSRARPKATRFDADPVLAAHVTERLEAKDSPMTISIELARGTHGLVASLSHECIYQAIYAHGRRGLRAGLHEGLHRRRRCRKHRVFGPPAPKKSPLGLFNPISLRPGVALPWRGRPPRRRPHHRSRQRLRVGDPVRPGKPLPLARGPARRLPRRRNSRRGLRDPRPQSDRHSLQ